MVFSWMIYSIGHRGRWMEGGMSAWPYGLEMDGSRYYKLSILTGQGMEEEVGKIVVIFHCEANECHFANGIFKMHLLYKGFLFQVQWKT